MQTISEIIETPEPLLEWLKAQDPARLFTPSDPRECPLACFASETLDADVSCGYDTLTRHTTEVHDTVYLDKWLMRAQDAWIKLTSDEDGRIIRDQITAQEALEALTSLSLNLGRCPQRQELTANKVTKG